MKKRKTLTIETHQVQVVRLPATPTVELWCPACAAVVLLLTPEEAARQMGTTTRALYRRVEAGTVHFCETQEGGLLLCQPSLSPEPITITPCDPTAVTHQHQ